MPIYTRKGDGGSTQLYGGVRVEKDDFHIEVCGNIDELSALLGLVRSEGLPPELESIILQIQKELITFCAEIVSSSATPQSVTIGHEHVQRIESEIDRIESELPLSTQFIISGDNRISAWLHLSRTVCRRAERSLVSLLRTQQKSPYLTAYLNRISDLLFVMARKVLSNHSLYSSQGMI